MSLTDIDSDLLELATPEELSAYQEALAVEKALLSPLDYAERAIPGVKRYPHTELLSRYVVAHMDYALYPSGLGVPAVWTPEPWDPTGKEGRWLHPDSGEEAVDILVVSLPPQHGKSFIITETVPAWALSRNPEINVILTGYEASFAANFSKKNKDKIESANIPGIKLAKDSQARDNWALEGHTGRVISAGAGGAITGKGAQLIVIDDPIKNAEDALSENNRQKQWDWWLSTVRTRRRKGARTIVVQTRWHEDDLAGRLLQRETSVYRLNIPALAFEGHPDEDGVARDPDTGERDPLGRKPGEALCPDLHTRASLEEARESADNDPDAQALGGALWFSCLYQGKPTILGGGILSGPFPRYTAEGPPDRRVYTLHGADGATKTAKASDLYRFITVDLAISTKTRADWSVMTLWGWSTDGDLLMLDMDRRRMEAPDHEEKAREFWSLCTVKHGTPRFMGIEDKTFGSSLIQALVRKGGLLVRPLKADTDKETRALSAAGPMVRSGRVYFPKTTDADLFIKECRGFPNGTHDDMVDTLSYAALQTNTLPRRKRAKEPEPTNADERARHHLRSLNPKKKGQSHPILGRW